MTVGDRDLPPLFQANDRWALSRQTESFRAVRTQLLLLLSAAAAATLADQAHSHMLALLSVLLYGLTILTGARISRRAARAQWQAHRAAAETLKSLSWQYMVHGGPFRSGVANPEAVFAEQLEARLSELRTVGWHDPRTTSHAIGAGQITPAMRAVRAKPFSARRDTYLRDRVLEQLIWYGNRAAQAHRAKVGWSALTGLLTLLALTAAALRAVGIGAAGDLSGLLAAGAAAGVAWQEVRRHGPLGYAHAMVEQELKTLRVVMETTVTRDGWAEAVAEAERLTSPLHTDWLARFGS
jgi:hypothetical protein